MATTHKDVVSEAAKPAAPANPRVKWNVDHLKSSYINFANANSTHAVSYCTEAGLFQQIGIPAVICGPGSIEQAHKPDEYIDVSELRKCETFMGRLVAALK